MTDREEVLKAREILLKYLRKELKEIFPCIETAYEIEQNQNLIELLEEMF